MEKAALWRTLTHEFRGLSESEYRAVPDPADRRRLYAYGDYTGVKGNAIGSWTLSAGVTADFRLSFEEVATRAGLALEPPVGAVPLQFWLHSLAHFLENQEQATEDRGHLGVWDSTRGGGIRDVPAASAMYSLWLAKQHAERETKVNLRARAVSRRASNDGTVEPVRLRAKQMIAEGCSHQEVCLAWGTRRDQRVWPGSTCLGIRLTGSRRSGHPCANGCRRMPDHSFYLFTS